MIVIVGAGPGGLHLACELGQFGVPCTVVERLTSPELVPKGQTISLRAMEHAHRLGWASALHAARVLPRDIEPSQIYCASFREPRLLCKVPLSTVITSDFSPRAPERLPQYETQRVLRERAQQFPSVAWRMGWELVSLAGSTVTLRELSTDRQETIEASHVVGADGGASTVRKAAGIELVGRPAISTVLLGTIRSTELWGILEEAYGPVCVSNWLYYGEHKLSFVASDRETWLVNFVGDEAADAALLEPANLRALVFRVCGREFHCEVLDVRTWKLHAIVAKTFSSPSPAGRVHLLGDAAHMFSPTGAHGLNSAVGDAANLGWKLAADFHGWAGPALLGSYHAERFPQAQRCLRAATSIAMNAYYCAQRFPPLEDPAAFQRAMDQAWCENTSAVVLDQRYKSAVVAWDASPEPGPDGSAEAITAVRFGHRAPHAVCADGTPLYDLLAPDAFTVVAVGVDAADTAGLEAAAAAVGMPLRVVALAALPLYPPLTLVRPDMHVAWAGSARDCPCPDPAAVVDAARGANPAWLVRRRMDAAAPEGVRELARGLGLLAPRAVGLYCEDGRDDALRVALACVRQGLPLVLLHAAPTSPPPPEPVDVLVVSRATGAAGVERRLLAEGGTVVTLDALCEPPLPAGVRAVHVGTVAWRGSRAGAAADPPAAATRGRDEAALALLAPGGAPPLRYSQLLCTPPYLARGVPAAELRTALFMPLAAPGALSIAAGVVLAGGAVALTEPRAEAIAAARPSVLVCPTRFANALLDAHEGAVSAALDRQPDAPRDAVEAAVAQRTKQALGPAIRVIAPQPGMDEDLVAFLQEVFGDDCVLAPPRSLRRFAAAGRLSMA